MEIMHTEAVLRQLEQREEELTQQHHSLNLTASSPKEKKQLSMLRQELETIPKEFWLLGRVLYKNEALLPRSTVLRAHNYGN